MPYLYPTPKQQEIIYLIYRFRFLNRIQIQTLLHHKDYRRINAWLKELTECNFLGRIYSKKLLENTKPAIYYLSGKGMQWMEQKYKVSKQQVKKYYEDKERSQRFIYHCIFLGDLYLIVQSQTAVEERLELLTKADLTNEEYDYILHPLPDAYVVIHKEQEDKSKRYLLEILDEGIPRYAVKARLKQYIQYASYGDWERNTDNIPFPIILLVCPNDRMKKYLYRYIPKLMEEEYVTIKFYLSTREKVKAQDLENGVWEKVEGEEG